MKKLLVVGLLVGVGSCNLGLSDATLQRVDELSKTADKLGGTVKTVSDEWRAEADKICELTNTKISQGQESLAAACAAIAEAQAKQRCEEFNKQANKLIGDIRKECGTRGR